MAKGSHLVLELLALVAPRALRAMEHITKAEPSLTTTGELKWVSTTTESHGLQLGPSSGRSASFATLITRCTHEPATMASNITRLAPILLDSHIARGHCRRDCRLPFREHVLMGRRYLIVKSEPAADKDHDPKTPWMIVCIHLGTRIPNRVVGRYRSNCAARRDHRQMVLANAQSKLTGGSDGKA